MECISLPSILAAILCLATTHAKPSLKVFILAGDEDMLGNGSIDGIPRGSGSKPVDPTEAAKKPGILLNVLKENPRFSFLHDVGDLSPNVTETVLAALKARENPSRPLPRVLFIGDSISGGYWEKVKNNLDGKAFVAHNPGNGEHSGTGARLVNDWVDLKQYLLNGQEYLELIDGVNEVPGNIDRYCPDFAGRTPELAGFVWFQGIADTQSGALATAYAHNLTRFI